jgi:hypothetical protein
LRTAGSVASALGVGLECTYAGSCVEVPGCVAKKRQETGVRVVEAGSVLIKRLTANSHVTVAGGVVGECVIAHGCVVCASGIAVKRAIARSAQPFVLKWDEPCRIVELPSFEKSA